MASYLQIENISKSYGPKVLFDHIGFNVNEGDKIALIAPNGTGKTSLMRILAGKDKSDSGGQILFLKDIRIAFLEQDYNCNPGATLLEQVLSGSTQFLEHLDEEGRFEYERRIIRLLTDFGLRPDQRMSELSGGEVKRVALSEVLATEADFLILDEPTNHLDVDAIEYLENYLKRSRCTLFMVTHDRYFLDRVCNTVMELDHGQIYIYKGDYENYLEKRAERIANYNAETDKVRNLLRRELEWMHATPCARTGKAKYRKQAFWELKGRAEQVHTVRQVSMEALEGVTRLGTKIIDCYDVSFRHPRPDRGSEMPDQVGHDELIKDFTYKFQRYDRIGIVGRNGIGKTTFIDLLIGALQPTAGRIERGESLKIGYYRQDGIQFDESQTVLETVGNLGLLNQFLFPHDMLNNPVSKLSGGERRRLYLLTILMQQPNFLILDEPTNDLDIVTLNILEEYLLDFKGSLLVVSHDRHFLDRVVDHLLVFCGDGLIKDFVGGYTEYRTFIKDYEVEQRKLAKKMPGQAGHDEQRQAGVRRPGGAATVLSGQAPSTARNGSGRAIDKPADSGAPNNKKRLSYKEQREFDQLEVELEKLNAEKAEIEALLAAATASYEEIRNASERYEALKTELDEKETRWLELSL
ncbi:MAG: ABC-F family ATP-binding cassette domain-containing protein [Bacteroidales bacterium]|nr:ABC-F family ATP-binding cassette domain-containing protein [Bacteroidales bacterium]